MADPWDSSSPGQPARKPGDKAPAKEKPGLKEEGKKVFAPSPTPAPDRVDSGGSAPEADKAWTIALVVFRGEGADDNGRLALNKVRTEGGLPGAFVQRRGEAVLVCVGQFESADAPGASAEVKRVQDMTVAGQKPYRDALLVPPSTGTRLGGMPQMNLIQAKAALGNDALYTLQVAVYGRRDLARPTEADLAEARKAAEQAAVRLRQEGEQAFYYHGPRMSMVTVGVFGNDDFDPQTPNLQSARLREARRRHPHNLYNGAGINQKLPGQDKPTLQASMLVAIPEK